MKKFFTLCLMFLVAGVLNLSAGYVLSGENVNGEKWNHSSAKNTFTEDENGDLVLEGVSLSGKFLVCLDQSKYFKPVYGAKLSAGVPLVFTTNDSADGEAAASYTNCTIKLTKLSATAVAVEIVSTDTQDVELTQLGENWSLIGDFNGWSDLELTQKSYGVYEAWIDQATVNGLVANGLVDKGFKFRVDSDWNKGEFGSTGLSYGLNQWNILQRSGGNIATFVQPTETYDKYLLTFCVEGSAAKFRIDGYKEAVPSLTRVFYESFDQNEGTGGNDGAWKDSVANGTWDSAVFDEPGWTAANGFFANKCIKLGASSKLGSATTPALGVNGNAELRFKAGAWNGDATTINITINNGGTLSVSSVTLVNNAFTDYTISISDATPESTITFSATKANKNRFFLDEVEVYANSSELSAAGISLSGIMKDAETAYYHHSLANPTVTVTLPAGATYMDVEVDNSGYITESRKNQTSDCTIPFYNAGNYTVRVTAYGEGVYSVASKDIAIETVSSVYTFDELINKGEGATCYLNFSPTVAAHVGKYLYLEGYDMWEGIRSSALVYASLDKTYKKGDVLQGFIATVSYYNGNPQLIPLNTSLGDSYSYSEPYVYEVEAGEAWKAFAVEANVNKYVRVKNAPVTANPDAVDGVTAYTKHLGVNMPEDVTKKYDVEGFINNFNGTIQIKPISFTAEEIKPFTYTEIVPANNAEVTSLSEIKITFPYDVTYDAEVSVLVMDGGNMITPTVAVEGNVATLTFDAITAYGSKPSLMVMEGAFKASGVGCQQIMAAWSIPTPPIVPTYVPTGFNPADGSVVEKIGTIVIYTDDAYPELSYDAYDDASKCVTVYDAQGNVVEGLNQYLDYASVSGGYAVKYMPNKTAGITEPGTYTFKFAEGTFGDETYYEKDHKKGRVNPEFTITYTIKAAALAAPTVSPANGSEIESPSTITLTFAEAVTVNAEAGELTMVNTGDPNYDKAKNFNVTISEDGLTATITSEPGYLDRWATNATYKLNIPAGYFVGASGAASEALEYSWKVVPARFTYTAVTPAQGDVESLETIFIDFGGFRPRVIDGYTYPTYNLVNANGETVTTAKTDYTYEQIDGSYYYKLKVTLGAKVTTPGDYFLTIPAGVFKDKDVYSGYNENAEMTFKWTVVVPGPKDGFTYETITPDPSQEVSSIESVVVTFPADVTYDNSLVMLGVDAMTLMNTLTVNVEGNTVTFTPATPITAEGSHQLTWNEGAFTAANGAKCATATINYTVAKADPNTYNYELAADPANGSTLPALTTITFADASFATMPFLTDEAKNTSNWVVVEDAEGNMYNTTLDNTTGVTISVEGATAPGTYSVYVPAKTFYDVMAFTKDGKYNYNPEMRLTYTVEGETVEDFTPVVSPAAGEITVDQMNETVITFDTPIASFDGNNVRYIKAAGGNVWFFGTSKISEDKLTLTLTWDLVKGNYPVGTSYTLDLPAGCIVLENGAKNLETRIDYTLVAPDNTVYDYAPVTVSPANGSEVESLEKIFVSFPYGVYDCLWAAKEYSKDFIQVSDENGNTYEAKIAYGPYTEDYYIYVKDATAPGKYTIVVPKGLVFDEEHSETYASGHANPEFTLTYTIVAPVVEDFTPVVNPAAGNVTKEQIKTTVLSFESPIASFDDSDVRYAKNLGSVWCSIAGSYTISEDKLSLTINWDFSPEVGLNYTLELPAGCIVLENGAKNLFTQVAYTVVAGPKDLAEFVVPAGINGYINYDETDVNAWAPEFPFTVSTTAYNTVAFAAELPSLPAGITAMEVIDENGEVIAILNQDGVAPLADGEIYYVKGETTKEYVDGAELKFRFRFTHLGVSETIQFSYIIAGGNITSIADVELDGNVIVRGNDIIAPEGAAIFTVSGIRVPAEGLAPGVYVVVLGNQAVKVMVK